MADCSVGIFELSKPDNCFGNAALGLALRWKPFRRNLGGRQIAVLLKADTSARPFFQNTFALISIVRPTSNCFGLEAIHVPGHGTVASNETNCVLIVFALFFSLQAQLFANFKYRVIALVMSVASDIKNKSNGLLL